MSKFFIKSNQIADNEIIINGDDVNHIKNVLRLNVDEIITVCDNDNQVNYSCKIKELQSKEIRCEIVDKLESTTEGNVELYIFQGLPKADKMELIIQKGTELGVKEFIPVALKRCVVKLSGKDEDKKIDRWNKIAEVAAKQCGRDIIPEVTKINTIKNVANRIQELDYLFVAYELEENNYIKNELQKIKTDGKIKIGVLIGPEGGLAPEEVEELQEAGAKVISLGKRILRTETVALNVSSIIMYELENGGI